MGLSSVERDTNMRKKSKIENYYDRVDLMGHIHQHGILGYIREKFVNFEENRETTAKNMMPKNINKMLDVGCKGGSLLIEEKDNFKHGFGIDLSEEVIALARKNTSDHGLSKKISFKQADLETELPFPEGEFDMVTCMAVLEHLFDPEKAIREINRVLRKGGYLMIEVPNIAWLPRRLSLFFGVRPRTSWAPGWDGGHLNYFTFSSLEKLLEDNVFKVLKIGCSGIFAKLRYIHPPLLSGNIVILARKK
jgi:ubiquinone/menaquinone biosynthesis C-methylase UbiE